MPCLKRHIIHLLRFGREYRAVIRSAALLRREGGSRLIQILGLRLVVRGGTAISLLVERRLVNLPGSGLRGTRLRRRGVSSSVRSVTLRVAAV